MSSQHQRHQERKKQVDLAENSNGTLQSRNSRSPPQKLPQSMIAPKSSEHRRHHSPNQTSRTQELASTALGVRGSPTMLLLNYLRPNHSDRHKFLLQWVAKPHGALAICSLREYREQPMNALEFLWLSSPGGSKMR